MLVVNVWQNTPKRKPLRYVILTYLQRIPCAEQITAYLQPILLQSHFRARVFKRFLHCIPSSRWVVLVYLVVPFIYLFLMKQTLLGHCWWVGMNCLVLRWMPGKRRIKPREHDALKVPTSPNLNVDSTQHMISLRYWFQVLLISVSATYGKIKASRFEI